MDELRRGQAPRGKAGRPCRLARRTHDFRRRRRQGRRALRKTDANSPYRFYWRQLRIKLTIPKRHIVFKTHEAQDDAELTDDYVVERLVMCGSVNKVVDQILQFREQVGDFGELVYAGMDWVDPKLAKRSMELMATEVMPRVNRAIGASAKPPRHMAVTGDS